MDNNNNTSKNFIEIEIENDLKNGRYKEIVTRFPPEPNGYLHIGHAKSIIYNYEIAKKYNGKFHLRFDDTNPQKENEEYVKSIIEDVDWLGVDYNNQVLFASNYFDKMYEYAILLIKKGLAYVCDLSQEEIKIYRGDYNNVGKNSPYRNRSIDENLTLFKEMKDGKYSNGEKTLRAKIDMSSPNINMRDPIIYRIAKITHHNTKDKWCIYPMYDFAHPLEDAIEGISHSLCTLEFEDHRPFYEWVVNNCDFKYPPRQIEFAKLYLTHVITGKRYIKELVDKKIVDGWDDPRLVTISALRRRGYTKESLKKFVELSGMSKANSSCDYELLEYCIREDLKLKTKRMMAIIDPIKLVIENYEDDKNEILEIPYNVENEDLGIHKFTFSKELYIERDDFQINPPNKFYRLFIGNEVRLMGAYYVKATRYETDANGQVTTVYATYDKNTKQDGRPIDRKVKGTIHFVDAKNCQKAEFRLFYNLIDEDKNKINEDGSLNLNENSLIKKYGFIEKELSNAKNFESFQFIRNGYFNVDYKDSNENNLVFNRIVDLKSSFKL